MQAEPADRRLLEGARLDRSRERGRVEGRAVVLDRQRGLRIPHVEPHADRRAQSRVVRDDVGEELFRTVGQPFDEVRVQAMLAAQRLEPFLQADDFLQVRLERQHRLGAGRVHDRRARGRRDDAPAPSGLERLHRGDDVGIGGNDYRDAGGLQRLLDHRPGSGEHELAAAATHHFRVHEQGADADRGERSDLGQVDQDLVPRSGERGEPQVDVGRAVDVECTHQPDVVDPVPELFDTHLHRSLPAASWSREASTIQRRRK